MCSSMAIDKYLFFGPISYMLQIALMQIDLAQILLEEIWTARSLLSRSPTF